MAVSNTDQQHAANQVASVDRTQHAQHSDDTNNRNDVNDNGGDGSTTSCSDIKSVGHRQPTASQRSSTPPVVASDHELQYVRVSELPALQRAVVFGEVSDEPLPEGQRHLDSPKLVASLTANLVPKPPRRYSRERASAESDAGDSEAERSADKSDAVPLLPSTPVPKDDKSVTFAKTNVIGDFE